MSMAPRRGPELARWLQEQQRPFRVAALARDWTEWAVRDAVAKGAAVRLLPGIIAAQECAATARVRGLALNMWHPDLLVTGELALHLYRPVGDGPCTADAVVPYGTRLEPRAWVRVQQRAPIARRRRANGVWCVTPGRAIVDAWHKAAPADGSDAVYQALWAGACSARDALNELEAAPRVRNRRQLASLLDKFTRGGTSPLEVLARETVFVGKEWAALEWQATLEAEGSLRRPDALHRAARVIIEFDGQRWHGSPEARERDRLRDLELAALGYVTLRLTFADLRRRPEWCRAMVRAAICRRLSAV